MSTDYVDLWDLTWHSARAACITHATIYDDRIGADKPKSIIHLGNDGGIEMYMAVAGQRRRRWLRQIRNRKPFHPKRRTRMAGK